MYTDRPFKTKRALQDAIEAGAHIRVFSPYGLRWPVKNGQMGIRGPHEHAPMEWDAIVTVKDGWIVGVK